VGESLINCRQTFQYEKRIYADAAIIGMQCTIAYNISIRMKNQGKRTKRLTNCIFAL